MAYLLQLSKIRYCVFLCDAVLPCFASVVGRALGCTLFFFGDMGSPQALLPMGFGFLLGLFFLGRFVRDREDSRLVGIVILGAACLGSRSVLLIGGFPCEVSRARCSVVFERGCTWVSRVMPRVCVQVVLVLCRCVFLFERGLYVSVVLRLAHLTGRGRVIVIGVPAVWT